MREWVVFVVSAQAEGGSEKKLFADSFHNLKPETLNLKL